MSWEGKGNHSGYQPKVFDYRAKFDSLAKATCGKVSHADNRVDGGKTWGVDLVSFHCTAGCCEIKGSGMFDNVINLNAWKTGTASSTFVVGGYGDVAIAVDLDKRPYTTSTRSIDKRAYTFEIASEATGDIRMTNYALNAVVETLAWLMKSGKFKGPLFWLGEKKTSNGYPSGPYRAVAGYDPTNMSEYGVNTAKDARSFNPANISLQNVVIHRWFGKGGKICPGWYFTERLGYLLDQANRLAGFSTNNEANDIKQHPKVKSQHNTWVYKPINLDFSNMQVATPTAVNDQQSILTQPVNPTVAAPSENVSYSGEIQSGMYQDMSTKMKESKKNKKGTILGSHLEQK